MHSTVNSRLAEKEEKIRRTSVVKLIVTDDIETKLKSLCSLASKLWNEVNYARRTQFFGIRVLI